VWSVHAVRTNSDTDERTWRLRITDGRRLWNMDFELAGNVSSGAGSYVLGDVVPVSELDAGIVASYPQVLPKEIVDQVWGMAPRPGCVNGRGRCQGD
jgi:hypothetical protein